jgi:hypothetical protein
MASDPDVNLSYRRVCAVHPRWQGFLLLSNSDDRVVHESHDSKGTYKSTGRLLRIAWEKFAPEEFVDLDGTYTHRSLVDDAERWEVHSFDIFDTLLARHCVEPRNIFVAVEKKSNHSGFAELRIRCESSIYAHGEYTLDNIYRCMITEGGLSEEASIALKALELEEEFVNLIPVAQHINEVRPGDILVSDMYLPQTFVARVVREKCGLHTNPVYLSSHGKSSGEAWDTLNRHFRILSHTGDNVHADIRMSERRGIPAKHTTVASMTEHERLIESLGYQELARVVREARLAFWHADPEILRAGRAQIEINFPVLFLTALRILSLARSEGYRNILFSSRDCYLLFLVFQSLVHRSGDELQFEYFLTSRIVRANPSSAYLAYLDQRSRGRKTLIVDLCGTGWSLTRLLEIAERPDIDIFLMHFVRNDNLMSRYRKLGEITRDPKPIFVTERGDNTILEALNTASHEMVTGMIQVQDLYVPRFLEREPEPSDELISCAERAVSLAITCAGRIETAELDRYVRSVKNSDIETCYHAFGSVADVVNKVRDRQLSENQYLISPIEHGEKRRASQPAPKTPDSRIASLTDLANQYGSDKGTMHGDRHNYTALYDMLFTPIRHRKLQFVEIGLARGGAENPGTVRPKAASSPSVSMWLAYFSSAEIVGFDLTDFSDIRHERFRFVQGDLSSADDLRRLADERARFDVIVDDGSHASPHQQLAFKYLFPKLAPGGIYVIEDLHWQSPVFENLVPGTPKSADFFGAWLDRGTYLDNPILSEGEMVMASREIACHALFPSMTGAASGPKLLVIRKI